MNYEALWEVNIGLGVKESGGAFCKFLNRCTTWSSLCSHCRSTTAFSTNNYCNYKCVLGGFKWYNSENTAVPLLSDAVCLGPLSYVTPPASRCTCDCMVRCMMQSASLLKCNNCMSVHCDPESSASLPATVCRNFVFSKGRACSKYSPARHLRSDLVWVIF